jgi:hypothetical protein
LSEIRRKLGFLEDDEDFDDLVAIDELDDGEARVAVPRVCTAGGATTKADLPITCE